LWYERGVNEESSRSKPQGSLRAFASRYWGVWWLLPVAVALIELGLHFWQTRTVVGPEDWHGVREALESEVGADDLVVIAPSWLDPVGRMQLGDALMTEQRVARADESRFPVAHEVALGTDRSSALLAWTVEREKRFGALRVRVLRNPNHRPVIDDLVGHVDGSRMGVAIIRNDERPCLWKDGRPVSGNLGYGPTVPGGRYQCSPHLWVGATINADLTYAPRRCIHAPPPGRGGVLRLRFRDVRFGDRLEGHHALYVEAERDRRGASIRMKFSSDGVALGEAVHEDGEGWASFGWDTPGLRGVTAELLVEISSDRGDRRVYCFEATTR